MKTPAFLATLLVTIFVTALATLQFTSISSLPTEKLSKAGQGLKERFGVLVKIDLDEQTGQIVSVELDAQCLETEETFELLSELSDLKRLSVRHGQFNDSDLEPLQRLNKLESVELQSLNLSGSGLRYLTHCKGIKSLKLSNNPAWDPRHSGHLKQFPLLRELHLAYTSTSDDTIKELAEHRELQTINLANTRISWDGVQYLKLNDQLRYLSLEGCELGHQYQDALSKLTTSYPLILNLADSSVTDEALRGIHDLHIVDLNLRGTDMTDKGLEHFSEHSHCQHLDLSFTQCSSVSLAQVLPTLSLQSLSLRGLKLSQSVLNAIGRCPQLVTLNLANSNVQDLWLAELHQAQHLEHLILYQTPVTGSTLALLSTLDELSYLDLSDCPVSSQAMKHLQQLPALSSLHLMGSDLTDEGYEHLANTAVTHLNLSNSTLNRRHLKRLAAMSELKELAIRHCDISLQDFEMFQSRNINCVIYWQAYGQDSVYAKPDAMKALTPRP